MTKNIEKHWAWGSRSTDCGSGLDVAESVRFNYFYVLIARKRRVVFFVLRYILNIFGEGFNNK